MIHPTAIVAPGAKIGESVEIGPYAIVDRDVTIGDGCHVGPHAYLTGHTTIGPGTVIFSGAILGDKPQDLHYKGGVSYTRIGSQCVIREYVTIHRGTAPDSVTVVGNGVMLMAMAHLGHNCEIGDNVVIANACLLAGHVHVGPRAFLSGGVMVHQFVRIGRLAMVGGGERPTQDIPPFSLLRRWYVRGANVVGLRRAGMAAEVRLAIRGAFKIFYLEGLNRPNAVARIRERYSQVPEVMELAAFLESTKRGIMPGMPEEEEDEGT